MAIIKMKLIRAAGNLDKLNSFIETCFMSGEFQPENAVGFLSASMGFSPLNEENPFSAEIQKIEELSAVLGVSLKAEPMASKIVVDSKTSQYIGDFEATLSRIHADRKVLCEQRETCEKGIEQFSHFKQLDVSLDDLFACEFIKIRFGHMPKENQEKLLTYEDNPYMLFIPCSSDDTNNWGVYFTPHHKSDQIDRIFSLLYFERIHIPGASGTVSEVIDQLKVNLDIVNDQIEALDKELSEFWKANSKKITDIYSGLKWQNDAFEMRRYAAYRGTQFYYVGWMPADNLKEFIKLISELNDVTYEVSGPEKRVKTTPVKIKNNFFFRPFEYFVSMYGLPSYDSTDITGFVAITYTLIFGMMFGDLGQGFVLAIAGFLMWKLKEMPLGKILIPCGISSMFFGFIYGSVFGYEEALDPVYKAIGLASKPLSVKDSIGTVLLFAIVIGIVLVNISMLINVYNCIKRKHFGEAFFSNNGIAGILFYSCGMFSALRLMGGPKILPSGVIITVAIISVIMLFHKEVFINIVDHKGEPPVESLSDFILQNLFEMLEYALSYFSNTVSFLRVGAFVVIHYGMMYVVFTLAHGTNIPVIIFGNILVIALEGLLAGIQALRLMFYEMFSRFLEGDGRPFKAAGPAVKK